VPVAMAMLPVKVEQVAMALASPAFWMVAVPEVLQAAVGLVSNNGREVVSCRAYRRRRWPQPGPGGQSS
jgi:hypothetical protein